MNRLIGKKIAITLAVIALILFGIWRADSARMLWCDRVVSVVVYPVLVVQHYFINHLRYLFQERKSYQALSAEVARLQKERTTLVSAYIMLKSVQIFSQNIAELVQFRKRYETQDAHIAQILLKNLGEEEHFCLVDQGSVHGIEIDMVGVWKNCILGRVVAVYPRYSKLILVTDARCTVAAQTATHCSLGIYRGLNSVTHATLDYVSHLSLISKGELVLSSGQGLVFPAGFALGTVDSYTQGPLEYQITIKPMIDVGEIQYCYLIKK